MTTPPPDNQDAAWAKVVDESRSIAEMMDMAKAAGLVQEGELGQITAVNPDLAS